MYCCFLKRSKNIQEGSVSKTAEEAAVKIAGVEAAASATKSAKQELANKMVDSTAGKRDEDYETKKQEIQL